MAYIEVIIHSREQLFGEIGDQTPCINYFCSLTDENGDSYSNDTIDYEPHVNWKAEEWRHQLLIDMHKALQVYAEKDGCILPKLDIRLLQE